MKSKIFSGFKGVLWPVGNYITRELNCLSSNNIAFIIMGRGHVRFCFYYKYSSRKGESNYRFSCLLFCLQIP